MPPARAHDVPSPPLPQAWLAPLQIGPISLANRLFVAPMAGVTDRPFRMLCRQLGAGYAVSEMVTSQPHLYRSLKTSRRANHDGEPGPIAVQIAGTDAQMMAEAARYNIERGAQIIDINMGCPAKKVCNAWAGSALMQNEPLALAIAQAVVAACQPHGVPVTLKMRTGWSAQHKNAEALARAFEQAGIQMLTVHGRTREQGYKGQAEYDTIAAVKQAVRIPVVANGDITSPEKAWQVLQYTGADALMIGRAAQGTPWIFSAIAHYLHTGTQAPPPATAQVRQWLLAHLLEHYSLYGEYSGVRTARKHIGWYLRGLPGSQALRQRLNQEEDCQRQWQQLADYLQELAEQCPQWPAAVGSTPAPDDEAEAQNAPEASSGAGSPASAACSPCHP
ncbi:tRNA dihydrouridine synthase DusB [Vandammella animalimorsus]|uniref:tRNA-dihydrouridine synthase B n=2 Tax=Vandammella animalimorsus TaxID=2029117 RepID=A0A2A2T3W0_9BURK|nr:tRNA dihydrouridine synthase DusB [Vandammella animalimorsus]PAX16118.1 tRNA dihydrouridine synthase DusB [Vandammella animalimorsus]PAX20861.1 tRNA dihydrouridine synthase DusB [Vandammella animalimorsus]